MVLNRRILLLKKLMVLVTTLFLITGIASSASAQHCNVKNGDSMWRIAKRYNVDFFRVLELNKHLHKNPHLIHPKDKVELPDGSTGNQTTEGSKEDNIEEDKQETTERGETSQAQEILNLVNQERSKQGLQKLTLSNKLTSVANTKAKDMAVNNYFDHNSPTYGSPFEMLQSFGVTYSYAGENIAAGQTTAQRVMTDWMNSSGHRANILNKNYTQLGVGYSKGGSYGVYWCQEFIKP